MHVSTNVSIAGVGSLDVESVVSLLQESVRHNAGISSYDVLSELCGEVAKLLAASPIRSEGKKSEIASLFVPRDNAGYLIIACPKCLRANRLEAMNLNGGLHETHCQFCGTPVKFEINHEIEPLMKRNHA